MLKFVENLLDKYHDCLLSIYMIEQLELSEQKEKNFKFEN